MPAFIHDCPATAAGTAADRQSVVPSSTMERRVNRRRQEALCGRLIMAADAVVLFGSFCVAYGIRARMARFGGLFPFGEHLWVIAVAIVIWLCLGRGLGLTDLHTYRSFSRTIWLTVRAHVVGGLILLSVLYLLKAVAVSRLIIETFLVTSAVAMIGERALIFLAAKRFPSFWNGRMHRLLVAGTQTAAEELIRHLRHRPYWNVQIAGVVTARRTAGPAEPGTPVLGRIGDVESLLDTMEYDEVVLAEPNLEQWQIERVVGACLERALTYHTVVRVPGQVAAQLDSEELGDGLHLITVRAQPRDPLAVAVKRAIDIVGACVGLTICGVAFVVFAPLIRFGSPGPALFRQTRVGKNGRRFTLYKFRTMDVDAESQKAALLAANEMSGHLFKLRHDPRVTAIGRFLRRTYLDELPQFWNVLRGDMSLVGTRPPTPEEVACYSPQHRRRLSVRPGITGLWQSMGNGKVWDFEIVVRLDCEYIDRWSIWLDLQILMRTCAVVARGAGH
jgi:exopolysaccharide biosynthesis polyprenyl glycosylphosphotransferase